MPVVLVTALEDHASRVRGIEAGADDFLSKPVSREELIARVKTLRRLHETRRELEGRRLAAEVQQQGGDPQDLLALHLAAPGRADHRRACGDEAPVRQRGAAHPRWWRCSPTCAASRASPRRSSVDIVVGMLNEFFAVLTAAAHEHEGTIFSMAGDSLLVGFNVPFPQPDAPRARPGAPRRR